MKLVQIAWLLTNNQTKIFLDKSLIIFELNEIIDIINTNLFFNNISIKSVYSNKNFLTPKFEIVFANLNYKSLT